MHKGSKTYPDYLDVFLKITFKFHMNLEFFLNTINIKKGNRLPCVGMPWGKKGFKKLYLN